MDQTCSMQGSVRHQSQSKVLDECATERSLKSEYGFMKAENLRYDFKEKSNSSSWIFQSGIVMKCFREQAAPSSFSNLCQCKREREKTRSREVKVNVCPCLGCQWERMPQIMRRDKWLSGANPKLNKWLFSLFAQSFLHNEAQWGDVRSIWGLDRIWITWLIPLISFHKTPFLYLHSSLQQDEKPWNFKCRDFNGFQIKAGWGWHVSLWLSETAPSKGRATCCC